LLQRLGNDAQTELSAGFSADARTGDQVPMSCMWNVFVFSLHRECLAIRLSVTVPLRSVRQADRRPHCGIVDCKSLHADCCHCVCRDGAIDAKYLQTDELPAHNRPTVSGNVGGPSGGAGGGGGSSLMGVRRSKDFIQGTSINHPLPQPPQFSQPTTVRTQAPPAVAQIPLASSYFPAKS